MANGANRLFKIMQNSGTDTISESLSLTVKSINPLLLTDGDKLLLTNEFLTFSNFINISNIKVGDKFMAQSFNNGQTYYISEIISSNQNIDKYNIEINKLKERVSQLESAVHSLNSRVTALENK